VGLKAPELLAEQHDTSGFDCGEPSLTEWLQRAGLKNQRNDGSRTYVVCDGQIAVAYYTLATGSIQRAEAAGKVRRNMPEPVPVVVLGRLAVDKRYQGRGIASGMLRDAVLRVIAASEQVGIKALLVHALSEEARRFYLRHGFQVSPADDMTLMVTIKDARAHLSAVASKGD